MGLFDIFTGAPAKEAAKQNTARLNELQSSGTNILNTGQTNALGALSDAAGAYKPLQDLAVKYGGGTDLRLDALGVNGPGGNARATAAFQTSPGYQFNLDQGLDALNRRRASGGMLDSGNADIDAIKFGSGLASGEFNNWLTSLGALDSNNLAATGAAATGIAGADTNKASVYGHTADSLVDLGKTTTNGINSQATQSANAQMAGSGNLWNLGLNVAKLATGGIGGMM